MSEATSIQLPWEYWVYQILALAGLLPASILTIFIMIPPIAVPMGYDLIQLPLAILTAFVVIYTCNQLSHGKFPSIAGFLISYWLTSHSPPKKIHRMLQAELLLETGMGLTIGMFSFYPLGLSWINWIGIIVLFSSLVLVFSGASIPDTTPDTTPTSAAPSSTTETPYTENWRSYFPVIILLIMMVIMILTFRPPITP